MRTPVCRFSMAEVSLAGQSGHTGILRSRSRAKPAARSSGWPCFHLYGKLSARYILDKIPVLSSAATKSIAHTAAKSLCGPICKRYCSNAGSTRSSTTKTPFYRVSHGRLWPIPHGRPNVVCTLSLTTWGTRTPRYYTTI